MLIKLSSAALRALGDTERVRVALRHWCAALSARQWVSLIGPALNPSVGDGVSLLLFLSRKGYSCGQLLS